MFDNAQAFDFLFRAFTRPAPSPDQTPRIDSSSESAQLPNNTLIFEGLDSHSFASSAPIDYLPTHEDEAFINCVHEYVYGVIVWGYLSSMVASYCLALTSPKPPPRSFSRLLLSLSLLPLISFSRRHCLQQYKWAFCRRASITAMVSGQGADSRFGALENHTAVEVRTTA